LHTKLPQTINSKHKVLSKLAEMRTVMVKEI
jgi:hypothetical protein